MVRKYAITIHDDQGDTASVVLVPETAIRHIQLNYSNGTATVTLADYISDFREKNISLLDKNGEESKAKRPTWISTLYPNKLDVIKEEEVNAIIDGFCANQGLNPETIKKEFREGTERLKIKIQEAKEKQLQTYIDHNLKAHRLPGYILPHRRDDEGPDEYYSRVKPFFEKVKKNRADFPYEKHTGDSRIMQGNMQAVPKEDVGTDPEADIPQMPPPEEDAGLVPKGSAVVTEILHAPGDEGEDI